MPRSSPRLPTDTALHKRGPRGKNAPMHCHHCGGKSRIHTVLESGDLAFRTRKCNDCNRQWRTVELRREAYVSLTRRLGAARRWAKRTLDNFIRKLENEDAQD